MSLWAPLPASSPSIWAPFSSWAPIYLLDSSLLFFLLLGSSLGLSHQKCDRIQNKLHCFIGLVMLQDWQLQVWLCAGTESSTDWSGWCWNWAHWGLLQPGIKVGKLKGDTMSCGGDCTQVCWSAEEPRVSGEGGPGAPYGVRLGSSPGFRAAG